MNNFQIFAAIIVHKYNPWEITRKLILKPRVYFKHVFGDGKIESFFFLNWQINLPHKRKKPEKYKSFNKKIIFLYAGLCNEWCKQNIL